MTQPARWLSPVPSAMPRNPSPSTGPTPKQSPQASGTLSTATPPSTFSPVRVSPAPPRQATHADSVIWNGSSTASGVRYARQYAAASPVRPRAAISAGSPSSPAAAPATPNPTASSTACAVARFAPAQSPAPTNRATRAVLPTLTRTV